MYKRKKNTHKTNETQYIDTFFTNFSFSRNSTVYTQHSTPAPRTHTHIVHMYVLAFIEKQIDVCCVVSSSLLVLLLLL